jgi:hypothetical protein
MAGIGDYEKGKAFELRSGKKPAFKMLGSSPAKQVSVQTGFGPGADANLKRKINVKPNKPVIKKAVKKGLWQGAKKLAGKLVWPLALLDAGMNIDKLGEEDGIRKFAGSMIWDEDLFTTDYGGGEVTKYNPNKETTPKSKKVEGLYDNKSLKGI